MNTPPISVWQFFWISKIDMINVCLGFLLAIAFIALLAACGCLIVSWMDERTDSYEFKRVSKLTRRFLLPGTVVLFLLLTFMPSSKELTAIIISSKRCKVESPVYVKNVDPLEAYSVMTNMIESFKPVASAIATNMYIKETGLNKTNDVLAIMKNTKDENDIPFME